MGHLQLLERAPAASVVRASSVSRTLLVSHVNQSGQASVSALLSILPIANAVLLGISLDPTGAAPQPGLVAGTWVYFWAFYLVPLVYISVFVPVPYCLNDCSFVV